MTPAASEKLGVQRTGRYVRQPGGFSAFVPRPLPPIPPIQMDGDLWQRLSTADRALGRLDGSTEVLPNPDLFVLMYVRNEAVLSSQMEGTQASLSDLLAFEAAQKVANVADVEEILNYVAAMNLGLDMLKQLPVSLRLIRNIHARLMQGVRGGNKSPGEFRTSQNWIGATGSTPTSATFVPPPPNELLNTMGELETFLHDTKQAMPDLIKVGLAHVQFETIHPFLDGNGRIGRLLITFLLCEKQILTRPLLYLSHYFRKHQDLYYTRLQAVREAGQWEEWLRFFLTGVAEVSRAATATARHVVLQREEIRASIAAELGRRAAKAQVLLDVLYERPVLSVNFAANRISTSYANANRIVGDLVRIGLLKEITGASRNRVFRFEPYLALFQDRP